MVLVEWGSPDKPAESKITNKQWFTDNEHCVTLVTARLIDIHDSDGSNHKLKQSSLLAGQNTNTQRCFA